MHMAVDAAGRGDQILSSDDLGARPDDQLRINTVLNQRIAGFTDGYNAAVANADVALYDAPVVEDDGIRDDNIELWMLGTPSEWRLALAIADHLAAAELDFIPVNGVVFLDFDDEFRVGEPNAVASCGTIMAGVGSARQDHTHGDGSYAPNEGAAKRCRFPTDSFAFLPAQTGIFSRLSYQAPHLWTRPRVIRHCCYPQRGPADGTVQRRRHNYFAKKPFFPQYCSPQSASHFCILAHVANVATRKWGACIEPRANKPRREGRMHSDHITVRLRADRIRVQWPIANVSNGASPPSTNGENRRKLAETNVPRGTLGSAKSRERE